jgi:hypothetical protein
MRSAFIVVRMINTSHSRQQAIGKQQILMSMYGWPRYFSFGTDVIELKIQMSILRLVTGESLDRDTARVGGSIW